MISMQRHVDDVNTIGCHDRNNDLLISLSQLYDDLSYRRTTFATPYHQKHKTELKLISTDSSLKALLVIFDFYNTYFS